MRWALRISQVSLKLCAMVEMAAAESIKERGIFALSVPGGSVLKMLSPLAQRKNIDWSKTHMWYVVRSPTKDRLELELQRLIFVLHTSVRTRTPHRRGPSYAEPQSRRERRRSRDRTEGQGAALPAPAHRRLVVTAVHSKGASFTSGLTASSHAPALPRSRYAQNYFIDAVGAQHARAPPIRPSAIVPRPSISLLPNTCSLDPLSIALTCRLVCSHIWSYVRRSTSLQGQTTRA